MHDFTSDLVNIAGHQQQVARSAQAHACVHQNAVSEHYDIVWCSFFFEKEKESIHPSQRERTASFGLISIILDCGLGAWRQNKTNTK